MKNLMQQTQLDAYHNITNIGNKQNEVYQVIRKLGHASDFDVAKHLQLPINRITGRRNELVRMGWVREESRGVSPQTGKRVIFWEAIENEEPQEKEEKISGHIKKTKKGYIHIECSNRMKIRIIDALQLTGLIKISQVLVCECGYENELKQAH